MAFLFEGLALYLMRPMAWIKWLNLRDSEGKHFSAYIAFPLSLAFSTHTLFISFQIHCLLCFLGLSVLLLATVYLDISGLTV